MKPDIKMTLRLRKIHNITPPLHLLPDDILSVKYIYGILKEEEIKEKTLVQEYVNYDGRIDRIITADIIINGKHKGIAIFIGYQITPEDCGITEPPLEGVKYV